MDSSFESPTPGSTPARAASRVAVVFLAAGLVAVATFAAWRGVARSRADNAPATAVVELAVDGMSCVGCAGAVTTTLEEVPGVATVTVDYDHRRAHIVLADQNVKPSVLVAAVEEAGYKARVDR